MSQEALLQSREERLSCIIRPLAGIHRIPGPARPLNRKDTKKAYVAGTAEMDGVHLLDQLADVGPPLHNSGHKSEFVSNAIASTDTKWSQ
jgi:hypothetical protein